MSRLERLGLLLAVAAGLATRIGPFADDVFQPQGVLPWRCPDVFYHLHRIQLGARAWPVFPEHDMWRNYPDGAYSLYSPLFDLVPATIAAITGLPALHVGVVWPALLGALAIVPLFDLLRQLHGRLAWLGVALFVVLPCSVSYSVLGRTDHHVAEVLMHLTVYALTLRGLGILDRGEDPGVRRAIVLGVVLGLSLLVWRGSIVYLAVPAATALVMLLATRDPAISRATARFFLLAFAVGALVAAPYGVLNAIRGRGLVASYFLSLFQPAVLLVWALAMPLAARLGTARLAPRALLQPRPLALLSVCIAITAFALDGLISGAAFLTHVGDRWASSIMESQPIWRGGQATYYAVEQLGFMPLLFPVLLVAQAVWLVRSAARSPIAVFTFFATACATALVFMQVRFAYYAAPLVAAIPGGVLWSLRRRSWWARACALLLCLSLLWPSSRFWRAAFDGDPATEMAPLRFEPWLTGMLAEIMERTPSAGDVHASTRLPDYCVLAPWSLGNFLQTVAERPVLATSGGPHETPAYHDVFDFQHRLESEAEALELLERRGCRYAITEHVPVGAEPGAGRSRVFARRLHDRDGSDADGLSGSGRLRWLLESREPARRAPPRYKVFELVRGAVVRLPRDAATHVETVVDAGGRRFVYRRALRPLDGGLGARLSHAGRYRIVGEGDAALGTVDVDERAVQSGATLRLSRAGDGAHGDDAAVAPAPPPM